VKRDLRAGSVWEDAVVQISDYVAERTAATGQRYVGALTDGVEGGSSIPVGCQDSRRACKTRRFQGRAPKFGTPHAFAAQGIEVKRLISDNAFVYRHNRSLRELLARLGRRVGLWRSGAAGRVLDCGRRCAEGEEVEAALADAADDGR